MTRDYAFTMAIRYFWTLEKLAKKIGVEPKTLLYQRNHAKRVSLRIALKIEIATQYAVRWYHLTEEKDAEMIQRLEKELPMQVFNTPSHTDKPLSERVFEAMVYEEQQGNRQGQRTDRLLRENSHEVIGRTDKNVAKKFAIGSEWTYRLAKKVMQQGTFDLIKAMDNGLPVYLAAALAEQSPEEQKRILCLTRKEIIAYTKEKSWVIRKSPVNIS